MSGAPAVEIRGLVKAFHEGGGRAGSRPRGGARGEVRAVDDVSMEIAENEFFALLGPSGCGKTTTLRAIAGFEEPDEGEILLGGRPMRGVPAYRRPVNTVFQDYALFPHMTVLQNVVFGLRMARVPRAEARRRALEALELVRLPAAGDRRPDALSGGQKQRVALARALVNRPEVLLLDEPLGALDLKLRKAMQFELKRMQREVGITFVYVTHDQEEALTMADRIAVMSEGRVLQVGRPDDVYERPTSRFVADFIGETNFLEGRVTGLGGGVARVRVEGAGEVVAVPRAEDLAAGAEVAVAVRPEKVVLEPFPAPEGRGVLEPEEAASALEGVIEEVHYLGTDARYDLRLEGGQRLVARVQNQRHGFEDLLERGRAVRVGWRPRHASVLR